MVRCQVNTSTAGNSERTATFERERSHLLSVAFRILGSDSEAEDAVQEAWIKYGHADTSHVQNVSAWLTTVVARLCLDSLRRRREVTQEPADLLSASVSRGDEPEELALLASELTEAFMIVLDELTPPQRVALVLHDVFGATFDEVAHVLGTTAGSAKKLASRARGRLRQRADGPAGDVKEAQRVVEAFLDAAQQGDTDRLVALLDPSVIRTADPQSLPRGEALRIRGVGAVVAETHALRANARRARVASIDGRPGIVVLSGQELHAALIFHIAGGRIVQYDVIADPQRLGLLHIQR